LGLKRKPSKSLSSRRACSDLNRKGQYKKTITTIFNRVRLRNWVQSTNPINPCLQGGLVPILNRKEQQKRTIAITFNRVR